MKILLTFDTGYAPHAATVMESIIRHCPEKLDFVVIYCDLNDDTQRILTNHFIGRVNSFEFYRVDESMFEDAVKNVNSAEHLAGLNTYLRLFAPTIFPNDSHIIYLDCDIIVQDNILNILNDADLSKPVCAAVEYNPAYKYRNLADLKPIEISFNDPFIFEAYWFRAYKDLKMNVDAKYFNSGVMILNLNYWREHHVAEKTIKFLMENPDKVPLADQDALNHAIDGFLYPLHPKWNCAGTIFSNYSVQELTVASSHPSIIHVCGPVKPWHYMGNVKYQKLYRKYRKFTPWPKVAYKDVNTRKILKKHVYIPIFRLMENLLIGLVGKRNKYFWISLLKINASGNSHLAKARL